MFESAASPGSEQGFDRPVDDGNADGSRRCHARGSLQLVVVELRFGGAGYGSLVCVFHVCLLLNWRNSSIARIHFIEEVTGINSLSGNFVEIVAGRMADLPAFPVANFVDKSGERDPMC
ncbi:MAG TPA: hypothetical protein VEC35_03125 [Noviherbaspirillum sp.]|nr:hypothetical protein [Noviherbaspirillum sp.]